MLLGRLLISRTVNLHMVRPVVTHCLNFWLLVSAHVPVTVPRVTKGAVVPHGVVIVDLVVLTSDGCEVGFLG